MRINLVFSEREKAAPATKKMEAEEDTPLVTNGLRHFMDYHRRMHGTIPWEQGNATDSVQVTDYFSLVLKTHQCT
jgi:hypothetical protein